LPDLGKTVSYSRALFREHSRPSPAAVPRRVLVLSYYFPPMGGTGVQRVSGFVKYLPRFGWQPTVLTPHPRGYFLFDEQLEQDLRRTEVDVVRTASADPTRLFGSEQKVSLPDKDRHSWLQALSQLVFVPDNKIGWMPPALWRGLKVLRAGSHDVILSTAPPYTSHLIGGALSRLAGVPLVTDFRDDWVGNPRHHYPTPLHRTLHRKLEGAALRLSRRVCAINERITASLRTRSELPADRFTTLPHAFDPDDFGEGEGADSSSDRMTLTYAGTFYDAQTPAPLLRAIAGLPENLRRSLEVVFVGLLPEREKERVRRLGLSEQVRHVGFVPHEEAMRYLLASDALWLTVGEQPGAETISLGKLPHYLAACKPILGLVPEGAARDVLKASGGARLALPGDVPAIREVLAAWIRAWQNGKTLPAPSEAFIESFDARTVVERLAGLLAEAAA
jgi:glycosyltransferase involved in cell wall biosynthesis